MSEGEKRPACRPHAWKVPEVGDDDLICLQCGRCMSLLGEVTETIRESILGQGCGTTGRKRVRHDESHTVGVDDRDPDFVVVGGYSAA